MIYEVKLIPMAYTDLQKAKRTYREISEKLSLDFRDEVEREIEYIKSHPKQYQIKFRALRQALVYRFPYAIFYLIEEDKKRVVVFGILHTRRSPNLIKKRIR